MAATRNLLSKHAAACVLAFAAVASHGATYHFSLTGGTLMSWELDASPVPASSATDFGFTVLDVRNSSLGASQKKLVLYFYAASQSGGFEFRHVGGWTELSAAGPQLYTGTEAAPTFVLGDHQLRDYLGSGNTYTLSISAVPEPAAWALMLAGLGGVVAVTARRRQAAAESTASA